MQERRDYHRIDIALKASFNTSNVTGHFTKATVLNISGKGMSLLTREKLELGQEIPIQVELPTQEKVIIHTKVMWCNPTNKMGEYRAGVKVNEKVESGESKFVQFYAERLKNWSKDR